MRPQPAAEALLERSHRESIAGQAQLAHFVKRWVAASGHPFAEAMDYAQDRPFLEPMLLGWIREPHPGLTLDQILYSAVGDPRRSAEFDAVVDGTGQVALPGLGLLQTRLVEGSARVLPRSETSFEVRSSGRTVTVALTPVGRVPNLDVEASFDPDPMTTSEFGGDHRIHRAPSADEGVESALAEAFGVIREVAPTLGESLVAATRRIVLLRDSQVRSSASLRLHGTVVLSLPDEVDLPYLVEDLSHQCGHAVFTAMTVDRGRLFAVDPDTPIGPLTGDGDDSRSLYVALHGVYTEALMSIALRRCLDLDRFSSSARHLLTGRLSLILRRMQLDLEGLQLADVYSSEGEKLIRELGAVFDETYAMSAGQVGGTDLRNQPYVFCADRFLEANPVGSV